MPDLKFVFSWSFPVDEAGNWTSIGGEENRISCPAFHL